MVFGGEADLAFRAEPVAVTGRFTERPELFGSVRARVGYQPGRWSVYGTGGFAWTRDEIAAEAFGQRLGWTLGGGIERAIDQRWSANAEWLFTRYNKTDAPDAVLATLSTEQVRVGLVYGFGDGAPADGSPGIVPLETGTWSVHGQTTLVSQYAAPFRAPYRGPNSLDPNIARETWDVTVYGGRRLWSGAVLWINPELDQGFGLSNTLGVAGFTSGEAYKLGYTHPYVRVPRVFVQQTINLGGATQTVDPGPNQFRDAHTANRLVATIGKFSVSDLFDTITYAHDPRGDFMNWALVDAATFDYAADAWGFTYGGALEWYQGPWVVLGGLFDLSQIPNSADLDTSFGQYQVVYELEHQQTLNGQPGKLAFVGFVSRGRMGRYADALALAAETGSTPDTADVRQYSSRPGINLNVAQQIASDVGVFGRVGWANGAVEPYEFTDVDRTASAGVSVSGHRWHRAGDTLGVATVLNGISDVHQAYLAAGGLGILVGDGQLPHPGMESIVESYYRFPIGPWQLSADYQFIVNPAFNRDRGPVSVISARVRTQF